MKYVRKGNNIIVRLEVDDDINTKLLELAGKENITAGSLTGIGATDDFTVGVFDLEKSVYDKFSFTGNHEITALTGNFTTMNGEKYLHVHINCADKEGKLVGGHLLKARISLTAEIFVNVIDCDVDRKYDNALGINLMDV